MSTRSQLNTFEQGANSRLAGRVALITGASRGIGAATVRLFAQEGARVVLAARSEEVIAHLAEEIRVGGGEALPVEADVSKSTSVEELIKRAVEAYGRLDFAVNNAGVAGGNKPLMEVSEDVFDQVVAVNLKGVFLCLTAL